MIGKPMQGRVGIDYVDSLFGCPGCDALASPNDGWSFLRRLREHLWRIVAPMMFAFGQH